MKKYEYMSMTSEILLPKNLKELDKMGAEGWELVLCEPVSGNAVFKRKIEEKDKDKGCKSCKFRLAYMEQRAMDGEKSEKHEKHKEEKCDKDKKHEDHDKCDKHHKCEKDD